MMELSLPFSCKPFLIMDIDINIPVEKEVKLYYQQQQLHGNQVDFPYWTRLWASSVAMAQMLVQQHQLLENKKLMELGAGISLPSFIAACYAESVIASDYIQEAVDLARANINQLGLENIKAECFNWKTDRIDHALDILLLSDVNYDPSSFNYLIHLINQFLSTPGKIIFITTPQRLAGKEFIQSLEQHVRYSATRSIFLDGVTTSILCLRLEFSSYLS